MSENDKVAKKADVLIGVAQLGELIDALQRHGYQVVGPTVRDGAIVWAPDEKWGEIGVAWCVLEEGSTLREEDILGHFHGKLARFKLPTRVRFIDELPRNATGKVLKRELREM